MPTDSKENPDPVATAAALAATALFKQNVTAMRNRAAVSNGSSSATPANNERKRAPQQQQQQAADSTSVECNPLNNGQRKGKWTVEEERYADQLIREFEAGTVVCKNGTTLRAFLAKRLNCAPMRISKKYAGKSIGKHVFLSRVCKGDSGQLKQLEQRFIQSVMRESHAAAVALNHINTTKSQHKAAINAAAFGVMPPYGLPNAPPHPHLFMNNPMLSAFLRAQRQHPNANKPINNPHHFYNPNTTANTNNTTSTCNPQHKNSAFRAPLPIAPAPSCPTMPPKQHQKHQNQQQEQQPSMVPIAPRTTTSKPEPIDYTKNYHPFAQAKPGSTTYLDNCNGRFSSGSDEHSADSSVASSYNSHTNIHSSVTSTSAGNSTSNNINLAQQQQQQNHIIERIQSNPMAAVSAVHSSNISNANNNVDQISNNNILNGMEKSTSISDFLADFDGDLAELATSYSSADPNQNKLPMGVSPSLQWGNNSLHGLEMMGSDFEQQQQSNSSVGAGGMPTSFIHLENILGSEAIAGFTASAQQLQSATTAQSDPYAISADNYAKFAQMSAQAVSQHSAYCTGRAPQAQMYQGIVGRSGDTSPALVSVNGSSTTKSIKHKSSSLSSKESGPKQKRYRPTNSQNFSTFPAVSDRSDSTNSSKTSSNGSGESGDSENGSDQGGCSDQTSEEDVTERKANGETESDFVIDDTTLEART